MFTADNVVCDPEPELITRHSVHDPARTRYFVTTSRLVYADGEHSSRDGFRPSQHTRDYHVSTPMSSVSSEKTDDSPATSIILTPLQTIGNMEYSGELEPLQYDEPGSFDLVAHTRGPKSLSLEAYSQQLFSIEHLQVIFSDPSLLLRFTAFLSTCRPQSVPILIYYLDALKALKAIAYANAIAEGLDPINGLEFTFEPAKRTENAALEAKASEAFRTMADNDLPLYITHIYIQVVSLSITRRITGTLSPYLREASEGLAEVFCLTDPSRPDNPIVFASEGNFSPDIVQNQLTEIV